MAKDPVYGMYVEEKQDALKAMQGGTPYYFCSDVCLQTFVAPARELRTIRRLTELSFALGIPVLLLTWFIASPGGIPKNLLLFVLATPVQFLAGRIFYRGTWHALRARVANMDTLVAHRDQRGLALQHRGDLRSWSSPGRGVLRCIFPDHRVHPAREAPGAFDAGACLWSGQETA